MIIRLFVLLILVVTLACSKPTEPTPPMGCTTRNAVNFNPAAVKDDGSCVYSSVVFYVSAYPPLTGPSFTVSVDGQTVGTASGVYGLNVPGNCRADFTVQYTLRDGNRHDWNVRTAPGATGLISSNAGTFISQANVGCIPIKVF